MNEIEQQREAVKKKIEEVNKKILEVEEALITARVDEIEDLHIDSITRLALKLEKQQNALKYVQVDLRELYDKYTYLLELVVEERRGEVTKQTCSR